MRNALPLAALCTLLLTACGSPADFASAPTPDAGDDAHGADTGAPGQDGGVDSAPLSDTVAQPTDAAVDDTFTPDPAQRFRCKAGAPRLVWSETSGCTDTGAVVGGSTMRPFLCTFVKTTVAGDLYCLPTLSGSVIGFNESMCAGASSTPELGYLDTASWPVDAATEGPQFASGYDATSGLWFAWSVVAEPSPTIWWQKQSDGTCTSQNSTFTPLPVDHGDTLRTTAPVDFTAFVRAS